MRRIVLVVLICNLLYWVWFWSAVMRSLVPYVDGPPIVGEESVIFRFGSWCVPPGYHWYSWPFILMPKIQFPTAFFLSRLLWILDITVDRSLGPLTVGSWWLLVVTHVSFLQWYGVGRLLDLVNQGCFYKTPNAA